MKVVLIGGGGFIGSSAAGRPFDVPVSVLCNDLASGELGWTPNIQLSEGIGLTAAWIRKTLV